MAKDLNPMQKQAYVILAEGMSLAGIVSLIACMICAVGILVASKDFTPGNQAILASNLCVIVAILAIYVNQAGNRLAEKGKKEVFK
jgi:hypothetical protein